MIRIGIWLLIFPMFYIAKISCQTSEIKNGAYKDFEQFNKNKPFIESGFIFTKISLNRIPELYSVKSIDSKIKDRIVNKKAWAIYENDTFYLNAYTMKMGRGYIKIEKFGRFSYFRGVPILSLEKKSFIEDAHELMGLPGLIITGIIANAMNKDNNHYFVELKSGQINLLTKENMIRVLRFNRKLYVDFMHEKDNESIEVLLKYVGLANEIN